MKKHSAVLLLGSNIEPEVNIPRAMEMLAERTNIVSQSRIWETEAVGSAGPNFLNVAIRIETDWDAVKIKSDLAAPIETFWGAFDQWTRTCRVQWISTSSCSTIRSSIQVYGKKLSSLSQFPK
jgi:hypothetical protein